ncbi:MAG: hypothetical protein LBH42_10405, partial [Treponema sp.]|nr:hypothetical protein [Treponema sp.]
VEPKGKSRYDAVINCKIFILSNDKIPINSFGESEKRRFYLVPFNNHIEEKNEALEDGFVPEYGKILDLLIKHAVRYFQNGRKMPYCKAIDQATADYFDSQDLVKQFLQDNCEAGDGLYVIKKELYAKFVDWCNSEQAIRRPMKPKDFIEALEKRDIHEVYKRIDGKLERILSGISLSNSKVTHVTHEKPKF